MACRSLPNRSAGDSGATMRVQIALILGVALGTLAAVDPRAAAAADRRAQPMRFELLREGPVEACGSGCGGWVSAVGVITEDTPDAFELFTKQHDVRGAVIALDSSGGSVHGALLLGRAIRRLAMITTIGKTIDLPPQSDGAKRAMLSPSTSCESMCAFVLLAGIERHVPAEAQVLVHDIWPSDRRDDPTQDTYSADELAVVQRDVAQLARYTVEMGGTFALLDVALKVPPWKPMHQLSRDELQAMKMATIADQPSLSASSLVRQATPEVAPAAALSASMPRSVGDASRKTDTIAGQ
jgi:hypothetical protein